MYMDIALDRKYCDSEVEGLSCIKVILSIMSDKRHLFWLPMEFSLVGGP